MIGDIGSVGGAMNVGDDVQGGVTGKFKGIRGNGSGG
jgi:hypothetical protein